VLSAQATDVGVNKATRPLFAVADAPEKMVALGEDRLRDYIKTIGLYRNKAKNVIALSDILVRELVADMRDWRLGVKDAFGRLAADPGTLDHTIAGSRLQARLMRLEASVEEALDKAGEAGASAGEVRNMYRLLGAYRGLSEALVDLVHRVSPIDWDRLREARF
jgi:hypothetical protein